ncbi:MAG: endonuclease III domain-containing protein [Hydrogenothermaceae bacterium]|nr:endonuclease III domain-containing protein [Hydrogenothermaceae bacterium]
MMIFDIYRLLLDYFGFQNWWPVHQGQDKVVEITVGAVLTQNTSWKNVERAIENLIYKDTLSFEKILKMPIEELEYLIKPAGFYKRKSLTLKEVSKLFLNSKEINRQNLLTIKGVGKETADSILLYALDKPYFVIDSYTKRVFSRVGFCEEDISYDELQKVITNSIPKDLEIYKEFHALIVQHCKIFCKKKPNCLNCPVAEKCKTFKTSLFTF